MSLILAILGILLSASEVTVLDLLGPIRSPPQHGAAAMERYRPLLLAAVPLPSPSSISPLQKTGTQATATTAGAAQSYVPRRKMVFIWQAPLMFMSYSVCAFLAGLTILVCSPFIRGEQEWGVGHNVRSSFLFLFSHSP
jgi:hypothetical protein